MNPFLRGLAQAVVETFPLPGPIVEVGSYQVAGQEEIADLRALFPGRPYLGLDIRPGPGVDVVADVEALPYPDASVGTVLALCTFEHVRRFWRAFEEVHRVLRPGGALLLASPFYFHVHCYPEDYWRFTPDALKFLLAPYPSKIVGWHGPARRPSNVWALAFREGRPPITAAEYEHYRARMHHYARMPLSWGRRLRYGLARLLCGRRPLAPYLDRERWQSECLNRPAPRAAARRPRDRDRLLPALEC
jgi:SAM-dependent methyltransferase